MQGICGKVNGGVVPEYYVYEAGQTSVGDGFDWMIKHCVPQNYYDEAGRRGISIFDYLNELADKPNKRYVPQESEVEKVEAKYQKYCALCDFFSQNKDLMKG